MGHIAQAGHFQFVGARLDIFQNIAAVRIGHGPKVILIESDDGTGDGITSLGVRHRTLQDRRFRMLGKRRQRQDAKHRGQQGPDFANPTHKAMLRLNV